MTESQPSTADLSSKERRALLAQLLRDKARASAATLPLSPGQHALYVTQQLAPESSAYNVVFAAAVYASLDVAALRRALQVIIDRHAALRTTFTLTDDGPVQVVAGGAELDFAVITADGWTDAELDQQVENAHKQPFDLATGPLFRAHLFTRSLTEHVLLLTVHHIIFDGWSLGIMLDELTKLYIAECDGPPAHLAPVEHQFGDYITWQQALLAGSQGEQLRAFWHRQLGGSLPVLDLPLDKPRPPFQSLEGNSLSFVINDTFAAKLRGLAKAEQTTLYALFLATFYGLLHRLTGQNDLIVGSPMANRSNPAFQRTIGYLVSPLPLRVAVDPQQPFRAFLAQVRKVLHEALAHEGYPFALMVEELQPRREPGRTPIMEALFTQQKAQVFGKTAEAMLQRDAVTPATAHELALQPYPIRQENGQFDFALVLIEAGDTLGCELKYNTDLFEPATITRIAGHFQTLLEGIVADPDRPVGALPLLTPTEREQILSTWNATAVPFPRDRCLHDLLAEQVARTPDAVAAVFGDQQLAYRELDGRANQLARHLSALGVGPDRLVGVYLERSLEMLVALLGVLKAGGAYVPLDPGFPRERLAMMLEDAAAPVVITQAALVAGAPAHGGQTVLIDADWPTIAAYPSAVPALSVTPEHLAYVIFTSGSTGRPKGVQIPHRAVVNFLNAMRTRPGLGTADTLVAVTTLSFDIAVLELYLPLIVGARVVLASRETAANGDDLRDLLTTSRATVMQATPVTWRLLLEAGWQPPLPFKVLCGGEPLPPDLAAALLATGVELWNMYGPTETTVWSTVYRIEQVDGPVPIGRPIDNTQIYVLNDQHEPQPVGVLGELYIGGAGVARGYLQRPELTAERFVADPFSADPTARLYRTGDVARLKPDGTAEVLGRVDHQVKIRGFRIELGEIETVLVRHPAIAETVVVARPDHRGALRLVAYLVAAGDAPPPAGELRIHLRASLPDYMIPTAFMPLEALPRTPNGKVDRKALPAPESTRARSDDGYVAPSTPTEVAVAAVWREVLSVDRVSVYDNFFDLGGHSLVTMETLARLERQLGPRLNPALIRVQTLGQLAASYDDLLRQNPPATTPLPASPPQTEQGLAGRLFGAVRRAIMPGSKQDQEEAQ